MAEAHSVLQFAFDDPELQDTQDKIAEVEDKKQDNPVSLNKTDASTQASATLPCDELDISTTVPADKKDSAIVQQSSIEITKLTATEIAEIKHNRESSLQIPSALKNKKIIDSKCSTLLEIPLKEEKDTEILSSPIPNSINISDFFGEFKNLIQTSRTPFVKQLNKAHHRFLTNTGEIKLENQQDFQTLLLEKLRLLISQQQQLDILLSKIPFADEENLLAMIQEMTCSLSAIEKLLNHPNYVYIGSSAEEERLLSCLPNYLTIFLATLLGALLGLIVACSPLGIMLGAKIGASVATALLIGIYSLIMGGSSMAMAYYLNRNEQAPTFFRPASQAEKADIQPIISNGEKFLTQVNQVMTFSKMRRGS